MLSNYFKIAFRSLLKYRLTSGINLLGLAIGLSCCLILCIYILNELGYDRFSPRSERIYRVTRSFNSQDGVQNLHLATISPPFGPLLKAAFPEMEKMTRLLPNGNTVFHYKDKIFNEPSVFYADANFFSFFEVPLLKGNAAALEDPHSILLSETIAARYFGGEDPMNKLVRIDNENMYKVAGVFKPFPEASHFHPGILISFNALKDPAIYGEEQLANNWSNNSFYTYVQLPQNYEAPAMEERFPAFIDRHMPGSKTPGALKPSKFTKLHLQKLTGIHLHSGLENELEANSDIQRVYIFSCIALVILLIACINYMNLSTVRSLLRAREIGIRKTVGAGRREVMVQFLGESVLITSLAMAAALLISYLALPGLGAFIGQPLSMAVLLKAKILAALVCMPFVIGILSGLYPAIFLSSFEPVKVLKGIVKLDGRRLSFRKTLVVIQFSVSIVLIIATIVVFRQLDYMQNIHPGFNKEQVITTGYSSQFNSRYEAFRNSLLRTSLVKSLSRSSRIPTDNLLDDLGTVSILEQGRARMVNNVDMKFVRVDQDFMSTYDIGMAAGRNFSREFAADSNHFVINATAAKALGWADPQEAVGKNIRYGGREGRILGVTRDFHFESMHKPIGSVLFLMTARYGYNLSLRLEGKNLHRAVAEVGATWHRYFPETPFQYTFIDENVKQLYSGERQQRTIFTVFSFIAIFVACLGLFGLSAFAIRQRVKEIGIRKVLGAGIVRIITLFALDFIRLVCLAALISFPIAWYMMHTWLSDFAYRIDMPWWAYVLSAVLAITIAFLTIGGQALKAAMANPVKNLRTE